MKKGHDDGDEQHPASRLHGNWQGGAVIAPPTFHATGAMILAVLMFAGFASGRVRVEIVCLGTIVAIALGLYFFPLPGTDSKAGLTLAFAGFGHYALITICALMVMGRGLVVTGALTPAADLLGRLWRVRIVPPVQPQLAINVDGAPDARNGNVSADVALWAVQRWGLNSIALTVARGNAPADEARERIAPLLARFAAAQVAVRVAITDGDSKIMMEPYGPTPAQRRANAAARAAAESAAAP